MDLVTFLRERLDEDEAAAKAAVPGPWLHMHMGSEGCQVVRRQMSAGERPRLRARLTTSNLADDHANAEHIARHDPARVLREVEAGRKILALHRITVDKLEQAPYDALTGERLPPEFEVLCEVCGWAGADLGTACPTLRAVAAVYADHPGYQQDWA